jgi:hypothetical protein
MGQIRSFPSFSQVVIEAPGEGFSLYFLSEEVEQTDLESIIIYWYHVQHYISRFCLFVRTITSHLIEPLSTVCFTD